MSEKSRGRINSTCRSLYLTDLTWVYFKYLMDLLRVLGAAAVAHHSGESEHWWKPLFYPLLTFRALDNTRIK